MKKILGSMTGDMSLERGQSLIFIALALFALFGMLALVIDGGMAYAQRRAAQNAADAGALAGARELCAGSSYATAEARAIEYTSVKNSATSQVVNIDFPEKVITVTADVEYSTFFASLFGSPTVTVNASATAGCHVPCAATSVLPLAWMCPSKEDGTEWDEDDDNLCNINYLNDPSPHAPSNPLYVIMTSTDFVKTACKDPVTGIPADGLDCDTNDDGKNDILKGGTRGWLNFEGSGSTPALRSWIENGYPGSLYIHSWYPEETGVVANLFDSIRIHVGNIVYLPVVTDYFDTGNYLLVPKNHPEDRVIPRSGNTTYYHVISFSAFKVTCVSEKKTEYCPGREKLFADNSWPDNTSMKTVEGYFIKDFNPNLSGSCGTGSAMGLYTLYLNK